MIQPPYQNFIINQFPFLMQVTMNRKYANQASTVPINTYHSNTGNTHCPLPKYVMKKVIGSPFSIITPTDQLRFLQEEIKILKKRCSQLQKKKKGRETAREIEQISKSAKKMEDHMEKVVCCKQKCEQEKMDEERYLNIFQELHQYVRTIEYQQGEVDKLNRQIERLGLENQDLKNLRLDLRRQIEKNLDI